MTNFPHRILLVALGCALLVPGGQAGLRLPMMFGDHMVIQRDRPIPVFGRAEPGQKVTVTLAGGEEPLASIAAEIATTTDNEGRWRVVLPPQPMTKRDRQQTLTVRAGAEELTFRDVLLGDVWFCSGQSNMVYPLRNAASAEDELPRADHPRIRFFDTRYASSPRPATDVIGRWKGCTPESAAGFSAVGYFLARRLQADLDVPVGVVVSAVGATSISSWSRLEGLQLHEGLQRQAKKAEAALTQYPAPLDDRGWERPGLDLAEWRPITVPGEFEKAGVGLDNHNGVVWYRRQVTIPEDWGGLNLELHLGPVDDFDEVWWDGHFVATGVWLAQAWKTPRSYRLPVKAEPGAHELAIRVVDRFGGGGLLGQATHYSLNAMAPGARPQPEKLPLAGEWRHRVATREADNRLPTGLYNGMVAPWTQVPVRGVVWYQGEQDAGHANHYRNYLSALVTSWRGAWGQDALPFLVVQLPRIGKLQTDPGEGGWAAIRDAQQSVRELGVGIVVTLDLPGEGGIHPRHKRLVGERCALAALALAHGRNLAWSGPVLRRVEPIAGGLRLHFDHADGLRPAAGEAPRGFGVRGEGKAWHWAEARIEGVTVVLTCPEVLAPRAVNYGWGSAPIGNLVNAAGLPAAPFHRPADWNRDQP